MILGGGGGGGRLSKSKSEEAEVGSWFMPFGSAGEKLILAPEPESFIRLTVFERIGCRVGVDEPELV